jgi:hypothetical protein
MGLRWEDVDFENPVVHVRRSVVAMVEGAPKKEASQKEVPLDAQLAESLHAWKKVPCPTGSNDWVFASPHTMGRQPYWASTLSLLRRAGSQASRDYQASLLSDLPTHFWNALECQRRESKSRAKALATCEPEGHDRCVYAGRESAEKGSAEQASADGLEEGSVWLADGSAKLCGTQTSFHFRPRKSSR